MHTSHDVDVVIKGDNAGDFDSILTDKALRFIGDLALHFEERRVELLKERQKVQSAIDTGNLPDFLAETEKVRQDSWTIGPIPKDLQDRRVEITGPVERKMVINALNSGARTFMADFEDAHSPTWQATLQGQVNLYDAVRGDISFDSPQGKQYRLSDKPATLIVRPRGWHLLEKHVTIKGRPISASLFDFGLFLFHNAQALLDKGSGPYFYLPKLESYKEARLWNEVFCRAQELLHLPTGTIKATVLIETITAAFQMDEILYELRDHIVGLNCGRWDYIFSFIKRFRNVESYLFPDRVQIGMTRHCMRSYSLLAIQTCHKRKALAIGGMAAQIPIKNDEKANQRALDKVREDKIREANDGHDGTWVAHPGLVSIALEQFDKVMPQANQISALRTDVKVTAEDLLRLPTGKITEQGLRSNISIAIQYMASWLSGLGCVPLYNQMEDAATAEISRAQVWQWIHHPQGLLEDGRKITIELYEQIVEQEMQRIQDQVGPQRFASGNYEKARDLITQIVIKDEFEDFMTLIAYDHLDT